MEFLIFMFPDKTECFLFFKYQHKLNTGINFLIQTIFTPTGK